MEDILVDLSDVQDEFEHRRSPKTNHLNCLLGLDLTVSSENERPSSLSKSATSQYLPVSLYGELRSETWSHTQDSSHIFNQEENSSSKYLGSSRASPSTTGTRSIENSPRSMTKHNTHWSLPSPQTSPQNQDPSTLPVINHYSHSTSATFSPTILRPQINKEAFSDPSVSLLPLSLSSNSIDIQATATLGKANTLDFDTQPDPLLVVSCPKAGARQFKVCQLTVESLSRLSSLRDYKMDFAFKSESIQVATLSPQKPGSSSLVTKAKKPFAETSTIMEVPGQTPLLTTSRTTPGEIQLWKSSTTPDNLLMTRNAATVNDDLLRGRENSNAEFTMLDMRAIEAVDSTQQLSEDEFDQPVQKKARKVSQIQHRANKAAAEYTRQYSRQQNKENSKGFSENIDDRGVAWLVRQANEPIISSPREYQIELFEKAKEQNAIAVLDTGSGKTLIAVLLLRHTFDEELEERSIGFPKRISFFLVHSVTLVFQQYAVLECNLGQKMDRFCGSMGVALWSKQHWDAVFSENMAVVCTADVLHHCLHHGFIKMSQINLLIFDEAHHAKKDHAYSRIIKDFYALEVGSGRLPKIFGMTASPVDSKIDVHTAAAQLETLLHSKIVTASDPSLLQHAPLSKREEIARYSQLQQPFETQLYQKIRAQLSTASILSKEFHFAKKASSQLGAWCADNMWRACFTEDECRRLEAKVEGSFHARNSAEPMEFLDARKAEIRAAQQVLYGHTFEEPSITLEHLSSKAIELVKYLRGRYGRKTEDKCIVFVTQRYTATLLTQLFSRPTIGTPYLRVGFLIGMQSGQGDKLANNFRQQILTLVKFRRGEINCLFATSVAEEGLDIPDCNLVIRFDLYSTMIQYIQSRGRARLPNSRYIHMVEIGNREDEALVKEVCSSEGVFREFCQGLDSSRLLTGNNYNMDFFLAKERKHRVYKDPNSGAKLTYRLSLMVLDNFVSSLPNAEDGTQQAAYIVTVQGKEFSCEVILPSNSPIHGAVGRAASTKQVAKCSSAFEACLALRKEGYLDAHFLSTFTKTLPAMRNALLAVDSKKRKQYEMRTKPAIWKANTVPKTLYLTILELADPGLLDKPSQPLGLLTRARMPDFPSFPLFFGFGRQTCTACVNVAAKLLVDHSTLDDIAEFTLRIFDDVFSKLYEKDIQKMPYFLVPVSMQSSYAQPGDPHEMISWTTLALAIECKYINLEYNAPDAWFKDRFVVDIYDGSRKFWTVARSSELKPLDTPPAGVAPRAKRFNCSTIMEYSCSLFVKSRAKRTFREDQPVVRADLIPLRRNLLDDTEVASAVSSKMCYLILEPLMISTLPTTVVTMAYVFPAIIHRFESYLIALEACHLLDLQISPELALEAVTKDSDNSEEPNEEEVRFQRGMGKNYERLEFLGDCFLKMATSISLYTRHPENDEYAYHVSRMLMICNQNLLNVAVSERLKLYEYIRSQSFNRQAWYPEGMSSIRGRKVVPQISHDLANKTIADVSEALIGAALLSGGFDAAVRAVRQLVHSEEHPMDCFADYFSSYTMPKFQVERCSASQKDMALQIEKKHPYHFKYPRLLRSAFTHPSYPWSYEHIPNYQRLEFLGDALLDMACVNFLYHAYPTKDPQWLTEHKMAMVSNQFLGCLCVQLGFHRHLQQFNPKTQSAITEYVEELGMARESAVADAVQAGRTEGECSPDYWRDTKSPPKCLPDMVEAYIGSIFVDSAFDYAEVEKFFDLHIRWFFIDMSIYDTFANKHPMTHLINFLETNMGCHRFRITTANLPDIGNGLPTRLLAMVLVHERVIASKDGTSQRCAKISAAKMAVNMLSGVPLEEFREEYGCDCHIKAADGEEILKDIKDEDDDHGTAI